MVIKFNEFKTKIINYIENKMMTIAPNLSTIVGKSIASKLITSAGGIVELSKMPACNVLVLGSQRKNLEGFSTAGKLHKGYLAETDIVKNTPEDFQRQALRRLSNKCVLAARYDAYRTVPIIAKDEISTLIDNNNNNMIIDDNSNNNSKSNKEMLNDTKVGEFFKENIKKKLTKIQEPKQSKKRKFYPSLMTSLERLEAARE